MGLSFIFVHTTVEMKYTFLILSLLITFHLPAQQLHKVTPSLNESLPGWAVKMYGDSPNIWQVDDEYRIWRQSHPTEKTTYTQYYKKWHRAMEPFINNQGFIAKPSPAENQAFRKRLEDLKQHSKLRPDARGGSTWSVMGPVEMFNTNTGPSPRSQSSQANIYCIDQSLSHPDIVYCGTEGSEIYKSTDKGQTWNCVSREYDISAVTALEVHPTNPDIVFAGEFNRIRKTIDGGRTWEIVLEDSDMWSNEILVNPGNDSIVLAATQHGLYRSTDMGLTWNRIIEEACYDIEWKSDDPNIGFLVHNDPALGICRFYKSSDAGLTWILKDTGWFFSDLEGRNDGGARLAVTKADPNRIYAVLIGEAKTDDSGFIGIWRSDDAGETWVLPNGPAGGPWDETVHPNMATIGRTGGYHQGFYNLGFDASDTNPDQLMAGFLNLWYSTDGGFTFTCNGGYCGNSFNYVHPDCQEIEINGDDVWMTSDGGVQYSDDFFTTNYARNRGITGSDFWGFGTGWNEDILVGGRYHNGNSGWHENWMPGECLSLGGGEAATGYVNPGEGRKTYYSDIGGVILPESQNGYAEYFSIGKAPNESYYDAESGEMEWDPLCWNTFYLTNENKIWKTTDGGANWNVLFEFGADVNARTMQFEISRRNPKVMYLFQRAADTWAPGFLWKTIDGGLSWNLLTLPTGYARRVLIAMSPEEEEQLWLAYADANDGEKIYTTSNSGDTWENLTTPALNGEHITHILHQGGTDGGIYLGTFRTIWFKDATMPEWMPYNDGLPAQISTCILRPFYRDHKIRLGAYSKGIWEAPFAVPSRPLPQPMINKRETSCPGDTIQFDDYSMLSHEGAQWEWEFPGGIPSTSQLRNPKVLYDQPGVYGVTLTVTNPFGTASKNIPDMIEILEPEINEVPPLIDFSTSESFTINNPDGGLTWEPIELLTCNPEGDVAFFVNNYIYSSYGRDEIVMPVNIDLSKILEPTLNFKVAYAPYFDGNYFIDSLKVLLTNNCGKSYKTLFRSGGAELSTTSSGIGVDSLYEYDVFAPQNCEEWRHISLDLSEYIGQYVSITFLNQSGYGNNMYLDDILIEGISVSNGDEYVQDLAQLVPNPTSGNVTLTGNSIHGSEFMLSVYSSTGTRIIEREISSNGGVWKETFSISSWAPGIYFVKVASEKGIVWTEKLVKL